VNKGHLNQYEKTDATMEDKLSLGELIAVLGGKALPDGFHDASLPKLHPKVSGNFEFWVDIEKLRLDLKAGDAIQLKTLGDSVFVDSIQKQDLRGTSSDSQLGDSLSAKIAAAKANEVNDKEDDNDADWD